MLPVKTHLLGAMGILIKGEAGDSPFPGGTRVQPYSSHPYA